MAKRIINLVCPRCKHGIKYDTLTDVTTSRTLTDYPEKNEQGRYWCKTCQHGTYANDDGLCVECIEKNRITRLVPPVEKKLVEPLEDKKVEVKDNTITLEKTAPVKKVKQPSKKVIGVKSDKQSSGDSSKTL